jgi:hypothetical protein
MSPELESWCHVLRSRVSRDALGLIVTRTRQLIFPQSVRREFHLDLLPVSVQTRVHVLDCFLAQTGQDENVFIILPQDLILDSR